MKKSFTLIELMIVIAIIAIVVAISIPNLLSARKHGNEISAISSLRTVGSAQAIYHDRSTDSVFGSLTDLTNAGLLGETLGSGSKQGYEFAATPSSTSPEYIYEVTANPRVPQQTGDRYFYVNQDGVIRFNLTQVASSADRPVGNR